MVRQFLKIQTFTIIVSCVLFSCSDVRVKKYTPKEFLNNTAVDRKHYHMDSVSIMMVLQSLLHRHEEFFQNSAYFDSTRLIIDSIVYSPNLKKLAAFVIVENPTYRQLTPDEKHEWYFDATCYLGTRQNDSLSLFWMGPNFSNSPDQKSLSETIRNSYFTEIAHWDSSVRNTPHYNLNDIRFWNDSSIWKQFEDQKRKKIGFEKEKKEHPENVYEPSHSK